MAQGIGSAPSVFVGGPTHKRKLMRAKGNVKYMSLGYLRGPGITLSKRARMELQFCITGNVWHGPWAGLPESDQNQVFTSNLRVIPLICVRSAFHAI